MSLVGTDVCCSERSPLLCPDAVRQTVGHVMNMSGLPQVT